jgi:hypothetical protein
MNTFDRDLVETLSRGMRRQNEQEFLECIRTIRLELMLLRERDRVRELEDGEWAELEQVDSLDAERG